jgi:hypothetical protein
MRSFTLATLAAVLLLTASVGSIYAAAPSHDFGRGTGSDPDFCGTGQTVDYSFVGGFNFKEDQGFGHVRTTWTNPANGVAVYDSVSGGGKVSVIDDGDGAYTVVITREGQPFRVQVVNGPLVARDAGVVVSYNHFDADDNYLGTDIVFMGGPHPGLEIDWCDLMINLLQL